MDEALRIAVSLRVIFHETRSSHSLLSQLGITENILLLSTFKEMDKSSLPPNVELFSILPGILSSDGLKPALEGSGIKRYIRPIIWWNEIVIGTNISRKDVTLSAANKDGGAHVDPDLDPNTIFLKNGCGTLTVRTKKGDSLTQFKDSHFYLLRQFGYELLNSPMLMNEIKNH